MKWYFLKSRYTQLGILFFFLFLLLSIRLVTLQISRGNEYRILSERLVTRVIPLKAPRGMIFDRNGEILAWNRPSYNVNIYQNELLKNDANATILKALEIIERNMDAYTNNLPLLVDTNEETGETIFVYTWDRFDEDRKMRESQRWFKLYNYPLHLTPEETFDRLKNRYKISERYTVEEALKILTVWNEVRASGFQAYQPVIIARDIKNTTVATLEEFHTEIPGVEVAATYTRHYPHRSLASHVLGYMGLITAEEWEANREYFRERGYNPATDLVGRWELERYLEPYLRGPDGAQRVQVDVAGRNVRVLETTEAIPGHDVYLTLDIHVQRAAEKALEETMEKIRTGQMGERYPNAMMGSVVVIDVHTGGILALVNKPDYDPNFFATGRVDPEIWQLYNPVYPDPRNPERESADPTLPRPMKNNAVRGIFPPGSTYKMLLAAAGLQEGVITPKSIIVDQGRYTRYSSVNAPACWIWNQQKGTHGAVDIISGIRDSCNYYFYELGNRLGIARIEEYAHKFGFGQPTGIELPGEAGGIIAGIGYTNRYIRTVVRNRIANLAGYSLQDLSEENSLLYHQAAGDFIDNNNIRHIERTLKDLGIHVDRTTIDRQIYTFIRDNRWNPSKTLSASIGQAENTYSPLQMANYMAMLVNGGVRYQTHLVNRIVSPEGEVVKESLPQVLDVLEMNAENTQAILYGLRAVTSSIYQNIPGTAARYFNGFPIAIGGKTGSAQFPGRDAYGWFVAFAPYDDPQIAVAVMVAQAGSGGYTAPVARAVFEEYFGINKREETFIGRNQLQR